MPANPSMQLAIGRIVFMRGERGWRYLRNMMPAKRRANKRTHASTMPAMSSLLFVLSMATHRAPVAFVLVLYVCMHA